eukprot:gene18221-21708_t
MSAESFRAFRSTGYFAFPGIIPPKLVGDALKCADVRAEVQRSVEEQPPRFAATTKDPSVLALLFGTPVWATVCEMLGDDAQLEDGEDHVAQIAIKRPGCDEIDASSTTNFSGVYQYNSSSMAAVHIEVRQYASGHVLASLLHGEAQHASLPAEGVVSKMTGDLKMVTWRGVVGQLSQQRDICWSNQTIWYSFSNMS